MANQTRVSDKPQKSSIQGRTVEYKIRSFDSEYEEYIYKTLFKVLNRRSSSSIWTQLIIPENGRRRFDIATLYGSYKTERTLIVVECDGPYHFSFNGFEKVQKTDIEKAKNLLNNYQSFLIRLCCKRNEVENHLKKSIDIITSMRKDTNYDISSKDVSERVYYSNPKKYRWHKLSNKTTPITVVQRNEDCCSIF